MNYHKKLLICASCKNELSESSLIPAKKLVTGKIFNLDNKTDVFLSGPGGWLSTFNLTKLFCEKKYELAIFLGICGVYNSKEELLKIYSVKKTAFSDCGIETEDGEFQPLTETTFYKGENYFNNPDADLTGCKTAVCNTVFRCRCEKEKVKKMLEKFPAEIETMESAAFFNACLNMNQKFLELRCSSNYVVPKKEKNWQVKPALKKLGQLTDYLLDSNILNTADSILPPKLSAPFS